MVMKKTGMMKVSRVCLLHDPVSAFADQDAVIYPVDFQEAGHIVDDVRFHSDSISVISCTDTIIPHSRTCTSRWYHHLNSILCMFIYFDLWQIGETAASWLSIDLDLRCK